MNLKIEDFKYLGFVIDGAIRVLFNSEREDFIRIFGEDGGYLFEKYRDYYSNKEGEFICYLDAQNLALLAMAAADMADERVIANQNLVTAFEKGRKP